MKKLLVLCFLLIACSSTKYNFDPIEKCLAVGRLWRYDHTVHWSTSDDIYGYDWVYDWYEGVWNYEYTVVETTLIHHEREVFSCQERR